MLIAISQGVIAKLAPELEHIELAARVIWKDEIGELDNLVGALNLVRTQISLDKHEQFKASMGAFHSAAQEQVALDLDASRLISLDLPGLPLTAALIVRECL